MIQLDQATDPAVHELCSKIANRCAWVIRTVLRGDDKQLAAMEFYMICREAIEKPPSLPEL